MSYISEHSDELSWIPLSTLHLIEEGVFAVWKIRNPHFIFEKQWNSATILDNEYSFHILENLYFRNTATEQEKNPKLVDFVVVDKNGNILAKNFDANVFQDENGFIHIESEKNQKPSSYLVKPVPHKTYDEFSLFFGGDSFDSINRAVKYAIDNDWIKKPKDFDIKNRTFKNPPISNPSQKI